MSKRILVVEDQPDRRHSGYSLGSFARFFNSANARPARRLSLVAVESSSWRDWRGPPQTR